MLSFRYCHQIVFGFCFGYLAIFRAAYYFGLESPTAFSNVVQLLLTLRVSDGVYSKKKWLFLQENEFGK